MKLLREHGFAQNLHCWLSGCCYRRYSVQSVLVLKNVVDDLLLKAEDKSPSMQILKDTLYSINYFLKIEGEVE